MQAIGSDGPLDCAIAAGMGATHFTRGLYLLDNLTLLVGLIAITRLWDIDQITAEGLLHHCGFHLGHLDDVVRIERCFSLIINRHRQEADLARDAVEFVVVQWPDAAVNALGVVK